MVITDLDGYSVMGYCNTGLLYKITWSKLLQLEVRVPTLPLPYPTSRISKKKGYYNNIFFNSTQEWKSGSYAMSREEERGRKRRGGTREVVGWVFVPNISRGVTLSYLNEAFACDLEYIPSRTNLSFFVRSDD